MALHTAPSPSLLTALITIARASVHPSSRVPFHLQSQPKQWFLPSIFIPIPAFVSGIWDSVLRAVPKKKTSHMKKRHRQMAGKALKDVTALNSTGWKTQKELDAEKEQIEEAKKKKAGPNAPRVTEKKPDRDDL
ncbi:hypothetical protein LTR28_006040 [Elasticomyces elasticus]|nr:hypothetical protein LTR28_006040 [Elasticomyces elasticus]